VDTKKEWTGNFKGAERKWCKTAAPVLEQDWPQDATGQTPPYKRVRFHR